MAKGHKTGGRKKGSLNKVTSDVKAMHKAMFERWGPDVEQWSRDTAEGVEVVKETKNGDRIIMHEGADPRGAADLLIRLTEFYIPKLQRTERSLSEYSDEELLAEVSRRAAEERNGKDQVDDDADTDVH